MNGPTIRISINALGGQGGGVLADWLTGMAEHAGWLAQSTSVPGVAQRTGATVYYLEMAPPDPEGREPIFALMPVAGDVDVVIASELVEAGRAIARGLVTPDRTCLVASTHRVYAISEKSALGDGRVGGAAILEAATTSSRQLVLRDYQALADANGSVISATLLGALAAAGVLPFERAAFEDAIRRGGLGVASSLKAFGAAFESTRNRPQSTQPDATAPAVPPTSSVRDRIAALPSRVRDVAVLGADRAVDYQNAAYGRLYLDRLEKVVAADRAFGGEALGWALTHATAKHLALWMTYEDVVRVADLKTRSNRFERFRREVRAESGQIVHVTEFMHPRFQELCDTMPRSLGRAMADSAAARRLFARWLEKDRRITTSRLPGFLLLWGLARLRGFRPQSLRYAVEQAHIEDWLDRAITTARANYDLAVEVIGLQRLVKGYGDTHANGARNFTRIMSVVSGIVGQPGAAQIVADLRDAALKDDDGQALMQSLAQMTARTAA